MDTDGYVKAEARPTVGLEPAENGWLVSLSILLYDEDYSTHT